MAAIKPQTYLLFSLAKVKEECAKIKIFRIMVFHATLL